MLEVSRAGGIAKARRPIGFAVCAREAGVSFARYVRGSTDGRSALGWKGENSVPFGSVGAAFEVVDATLFARSLPSSSVGVGATDRAIWLTLYPKANVMPTGLAPVARADLTVGLARVAPARIRGNRAAEIGQQRIPMMAAQANPVTASQRMSLASLIWILGESSWS